jgi:hypothetical protein
MSLGGVSTQVVFGCLDVSTSLKNVILHWYFLLFHPCENSFSLSWYLLWLSVEIQVTHLLQFHSSQPNAAVSTWTIILLSLHTSSQLLCQNQALFLWNLLTTTLLVFVCQTLTQTCEKMAPMIFWNQWHSPYRGNEWSNENKKSKKIARPNSKKCVKRMCACF